MKALGITIIALQILFLSILGFHDNSIQDDIREIHVQSVERASKFSDDYYALQAKRQWKELLKVIDDYHDSVLGALNNQRDKQASDYADFLKVSADVERQLLDLKTKDANHVTIWMMHSPKPLRVELGLRDDGVVLWREEVK